MLQVRFEFGASNFSSDESVLRDGGVELSQKQHVIFDAHWALIGHVAALLEILDRTEDFFGVVERLAELDERISFEERRLQVEAVGQQEESQAAPSSDVKRLTLKDLDI